MKWSGGIILLLVLMIATNAPAVEPASSSTEQQTTEQTTKEPQLPSRLRELELEQLMNIEVSTVTRRESTVGESAAAIYVITQEDIRRSGATTIPELFRRVPGMDVARIDNNKWAISARGFNDRRANKLLVQIDGRVLYNPLFSGVFWDSVDYPLADIERIEIIRGPGASLWGANAVNGIINIITKSAKDTQDGMLTAGGGNEEKGFGTLRYGGKRGEDLFFRAYGKGFDRDAQFSDAGDTNDEWRGGSGGFRSDWQKTKQDLVTFQGDYLRSEADNMFLLSKTAPPYAFTSLDTESTTDVNILGRWTRQVDPDSSWSVHFYWERFDRKLESLQIKLGWDIYDLDFQHQLKRGDQKIVYGFGYRLIDMFAGNSGSDNGFFLSWDRNDRDAHVISAFVHDEIALVENKASVIFGSKFEQNDKTGFEVQPTLRLLSTPTQSQTVWAAVSRAVRTPSEVEDGVRARSLPVSIVPPVFPMATGNPGLDSEKLWAYELGYRVQARTDLSVDSALFYNRYSDITTARPGAVQPGPDGTFTLPLTVIKGVDAETYGAELAATWQATRRWRLYAAYTYLKMKLDPTEPGLAPDAEAAEGQSPQNQVFLQSSWNVGSNTEFDLIGRYVDRIKALIPGNALSVQNTIDSYTALDARLARKLGKNLTLEVVGRNLLDNHHPEFGTSPFFRTEPAEIQRDVYGKVTWLF